MSEDSCSLEGVEVGEDRRKERGTHYMATTPEESYSVQAVFGGSLVHRRRSQERVWSPCVWVRVGHSNKQSRSIGGSKWVRKLRPTVAYFGMAHKIRILFFFIFKELFKKKKNM